MNFIHFSAILVDSLWFFRNQIVHGIAILDVARLVDSLDSFWRTLGACLFMGSGCGLGQDFSFGSISWTRAQKKFFLPHALPDGI